MYPGHRSALAAMSLSVDVGLECTLVTLIFFLPEELVESLAVYSEHLSSIYWLFRFLCLDSRRIFANMCCLNSSHLIRNFFSSAVGRGRAGRPDNDQQHCLPPRSNGKTRGCYCSC